MSPVSKLINLFNIPTHKNRFAEIPRIYHFFFASKITFQNLLRQSCKINMDRDGYVESSQFYDISFKIKKKTPRLGKRVSPIFKLKREND